MTNLSPAAQAVMIAATNGNTNVINDPVYRQRFAATLRAAADQVVPDNEITPWGSTVALSKPAASIRASILAIAAELKGASAE